MQSLLKNGLIKVPLFDEISLLDIIGAYNNDYYYISPVQHSDSLQEDAYYWVLKDGETLIATSKIDTEGLSNSSPSEYVTPVITKQIDGVCDIKDVFAVSYYRNNDGSVGVPYIINHLPDEMTEINEIYLTATLYMMNSQGSSGSDYNASLNTILDSVYLMDTSFANVTDIKVPITAEQYQSGIPFSSALLSQAVSRYIDAGFQGTFELSDGTKIPVNS